MNNMERNLVQLAMLKAQNTPEIRNSPMGQEFLQIMNSGNTQAGEQMANNILNTLGLNRDEAINQAYAGLSRMNFR